MGTVDDGYECRSSQTLWLFYGEMRVINRSMFVGDYGERES